LSQGRRVGKSFYESVRGPLRLDFRGFSKNVPKTPSWVKEIDCQTKDPERREKPARRGRKRL